MLRLKLNDKLNFGKHKNRTLCVVAEDDPEYILWLDDNEIVKIDQRIIKRCEEATSLSISDEEILCFYGDEWWKD